MTFKLWNSEQFFWYGVSPQTILEKNPEKKLKIPPALWFWKFFQPSLRHLANIIQRLARRSALNTSKPCLTWGFTSFIAGWFIGCFLKRVQVWCPKFTNVYFEEILLSKLYMLTFGWTLVLSIQDTSSPLAAFPLLSPSSSQRRVAPTCGTLWTNRASKNIPNHGPTGNCFLDWEVPKMVVPNNNHGFSH